MPQRNTPERRDMLAARAEAQLARGVRLSDARRPKWPKWPWSAPQSVTGLFTRVPTRKRYSTRGQRGEPWRTKKWTPARKADREETLHG